MEGLIETSLNFEIGRYQQINSHMRIPYFLRCKAQHFYFVSFIFLLLLLLSFGFLPEHKSFPSEISLYLPNVF